MALKKSKWVPPSKEVQEELFVFGYSCKVFRDDEKALYLDQGKHLIPWMGNESIKIDRYDCRGPLHDVRRFVAPPGGYNRFESLSTEEKRIEELCDEERYMALYKDEDEEALYHEEEMKRLQQELSKDPGYAMVRFSYDDPTGSHVKDGEDSSDLPIEEGNIYLDDTYVPPPELEVPPGMLVPPTKKLNAIMQRTAMFISKQGRQMEIVLKTKQSRNPQFGFLNFDHSLNPFYSHVIKMIQGGTYEPPPEEEPPKAPVKEETESDSDDGDICLHPSLMSVRSVAGALPGSVEVKQELENQKLPPQTASTLDATSSYGQLISQIRERQLQRDTAESEVHAAAAAELLAAKKEVVEPTGESKVIIDKMASYVVKNGRDFEEIVKAKNDPRFDFIKKDNIYRPYYDFKVAKYEEILKGTSTNGEGEGQKKGKTKEDTSKNIAPISFKLKPKEAEPVKLVPSSVQLGADEPEEGEEPIEPEPSKPSIKQNVSINRAFMDKVRPLQVGPVEENMETTSGGFGVMNRPKVELRSYSPEPEAMDLESSSESEDEPLKSVRTELPTSSEDGSPQKPQKAKPVDIFAEEEQSQHPPTPPPEPQKPRLSIEDYKTRMLNRLKTTIAVESTVSTEVRRVDRRLAENELATPSARQPSSSSESEDDDTRIKRNRKRRAALLLARAALPPAHSNSWELPLEEKRTRDSPRPVERSATPPVPPTSEREKVEHIMDLDRVKTPPAPPSSDEETIDELLESHRIDEPSPSPPPFDAEEEERQIRLRLERRHLAAMQSVESVTPPDLEELQLAKSPAPPVEVTNSAEAEEVKEKLLKQDRKQRAAMMMAMWRKEEKPLVSPSALPSVEPVCASPRLDIPTSSDLPTSPPTGSPPTTPPLREIFTLESDEDIQIIGAVPGKRRRKPVRVSSPSEDGEVSSSEEKPSAVQSKSRSSSSEKDKRRRRSRSRSPQRSREKIKKKKEEKPKKDKKKRKKESTRDSSATREDRSSRHRKSKRRKKPRDDENDERRDKKKRRKEKRKRSPSSSSSSPSSEPESPAISRITFSPSREFKVDSTPSLDAFRDEDSRGMSGVQPTVAKLTEDLRAKVRALINNSMPSHS